MATANYEKRTCNNTDGDGSRPIPVGLPPDVQITAALCRRCWLSSKLVSLDSGFCTYKFLRNKMTLIAPYTLQLCILTMSTGRSVVPANRTEWHAVKIEKVGSLANFFFRVDLGDALLSGVSHAL